jgi:purine-binding chemotaxis protein CheW
MKYLSFIVDGEFFAADVTLVQRVVRKMIVTPVPAAPNAVVGIANLKGRVITVLNLPELSNRTKNRKRGNAERMISAIVFKTSSGSDHQMGLIIDKPGNLIDISTDDIKQPNLTTGADKSFFISGIVETNEKLYRIIDVDSIAQYYQAPGEMLSENTFERTE